MMPITIYLSKVVVFSCLLFVYYWLFLRNKQFHAYNRFYLLAVLVLSWLIPFIKINVAAPIVAEVDDVPAMQLVNIIATGNSSIEQVNVETETQTINWWMIITIGYYLVSAVFLIALMHALLKIYQLLKKYPCQNFKEVYLILTQANGTPFSFFKYIFWNTAIDVNTTIGKQMLQHELIHVQQKHSADKLFTQLNIIIGWFNPIFWLIKHELNMIHEFIADSKSVKDGNTDTLARMLLAAAYPQQQYLLTNPFFFSPIKRRLAMLTKSKKPSYAYIRRIIVLPLTGLIILLFAFRKADANQYKTSKLAKEYVVLIDAGHGGHDHGAKTANGILEKDIALLLANTIKETNTNSQLKIVMLREKDVFYKIDDRTKIINEINPDVFISLHANWQPSEAKDKLSGFEIYVPNQASRVNKEDCSLLAANIESSLKSSFNSRGIRIRDMGIYVLEHSQVPAILIESGYLSNDKDVALLLNQQQRTLMARLLLKGVESFLQAKEKTITHENRASKKSYPDTLSWKIDLIAKYKLSKEKFKESAVKQVLYDTKNKRFTIANHQSKWEGSFTELTDLYKQKGLSYNLYYPCLITNLEDKVVENKASNLIINGNLELSKSANAVKYKVDIVASTNALSDQSQQSIILTNAEIKCTIDKTILDLKADTVTIAKDLNLFSDENEIGNTSIFIDGSIASLGKLQRLAPSTIQHLYLFKTVDANSRKSYQLNIMVTTKEQAEKRERSFLNNHFITKILHNSYISQPYGEVRNQKITGFNEFVEISSATDNQVKTLESGYVKFASVVGDDKVVIIKVANSFHTYINLKQIQVKQGEFLQQGTILGEAVKHDNQFSVQFGITNKEGKFLNPTGEYVVGK